MYKVRIDKFEGPFDLLIYLLENAKMDIYDIKVAEITEQYIAYLKEMEDLNIEVETEFIVLAAVLIRLKSHMLLPRVSDNPDDDVIVEDPRLELQTRLLDYMRTKKTAEILQELEEYNLEIHEKPAEDLSRYIGAPDEILKASDEQLVNAFILFLTRKKKIEEVQRRYQRVRRRKESIESRIKDMTKALELKLKPGISGISFMELLPEKHDIYDITISFMSLLSMIKNQGYDAEQRENFGEITVKRKDPEILRAQAEAENAGVIEYSDDEFDDMDETEDDASEYGYGDYDYNEDDRFADYDIELGTQSEAEAENV
ncbi:MAG: segregation/condensation protein A [Mogibacterium sp.]|nr:segregation/condensation protein A [Mogibacterium sp.]